MKFKIVRTTMSLQVMFDASYVIILWICVTLCVLHIMDILNACDSIFEFKC